jgi:hypothetical protein
MKLRTFLALVGLATGTYALAATSGQVAVGDPISKVYRSLGTPTIEFPLKGRFIQNYDHCVIISSNGVVITMKKNVESSSADTNTKKQAPVPTASDSLLRNATKGDTESQYRLAYCYQSGTGAPQDYGECIRWYTRAAMQGHMASQHNLGVIHMTGNGVEKDYEEAYTWAVLAATNGNDTVAKALVNLLTIEQELSGRLKALRILDRLGEPTYPAKESSDSIAKHDRLKTTLLD